MKTTEVWIVEKYAAFEGYETVGVFATEDRAQRFIENARRRRKGYHRSRRWKVRGGNQ